MTEAKKFYININKLLRYSIVEPAKHVKKCKKNAFSFKEANKYLELLLSNDSESNELGISLLETSKIYKHYGVRIFGKHLETLTHAGYFLLQFTK